MAAAIILALISFGLLFIIYVIIYAGKNDELVYLTVDADSVVHSTGTGETTLTNPRNEWEPWAIGKDREDFEADLTRSRRRAAPGYV